MPSIISPESIEAWDTYNRINGSTNETYASYVKLPARWIEQMNVIETEINRIDVVRKKQAETEAKSE